MVIGGSVVNQRRIIEIPCGTATDTDNKSLLTNNQRLRTNHYRNPRLNPRTSGSIAAGEFDEHVLEGCLVPVEGAE